MTSLGEDENARALAGGQTLINVMKVRAAAPDVLVDLAGIEELRAIGRGDVGHVLGAMATYADVIASPEVNEARPVLARVCAQIADVQVRNRGTVGGNVCASDPTNHLPPLMVSLGASMTIVGAEGERTVPAEEFFLGVFFTAVGPGNCRPRSGSPRPPAATASRPSRSAARARASPTRPREGTAWPRIPPASSGRGERRRRGGRCAGRGASRPALGRPRLDRLPSASRGGARGAGGAEGELQQVTVNGEIFEREAEPRRLLVHFIRDDLELTGTHVGCDTGNCGACSVILDGRLVKSCMVLAVQANGSTIETVEGLAPGDELHPLQEAFSAHHALQCGYCTPGMLMSAKYLLDHNPEPTEGEIRRVLQGNNSRPHPGNAGIRPQFRRFPGHAWHCCPNSINLRSQRGVPSRAADHRAGR